MNAAQTPLSDLLDEVPEDIVLGVHGDGPFPSYTNIPIGKLAREAAAELRRLRQHERALAEWLEKTEWVQQTAQPGELGMHRADVLRKRLEALA